MWIAALPYGTSASTQRRGERRIASGVAVNLNDDSRSAAGHNSMPTERDGCVTPNRGNWGDL
jgi:hypothetical protein